VTYSVSPVVLWALGEMTSVLLMACIPAAPKAFTGQSFITRTVSCFASWTASSEYRIDLRGCRESTMTNGSRFQKIHGNNSLLLTAITTVQGISVYSESTERLQYASIPSETQAELTIDMPQEIDSSFGGDDVRGSRQGRQEHL
jgi:hypothetical protein